MCSANSIFVSNRLLSDPFDTIAESDIRHIVGNIDRPGICMLIAPEDPQIRPLSNEYIQVTYAQYDSRRDNHFQGTSLHLSFTNWSLPLDSYSMRTTDHSVHYVESAISVIDRGEWVANLDILSVDFGSLIRVAPRGPCSGSHPHQEARDYTLIDN